jgi:hypothetical protein
MDDYESPAILVGPSKSVALHLNMDFIAEMFGIKLISLGEKANHAKIERRPKYCDHTFRAADNSL